MARKKNIGDKREDSSASGDNLFTKQMNILQEEFGENVIQSLESLENKTVYGISTGSIGLDYLISPECGGMPEGHVLELYGDYSTGKTTLAMGLCANVTVNGKRVVFIDAERSLKLSLAKNAGVDLKLFSVIKTHDVNTSVTILKKLIRTGEVGLIVIDSVAAWKPKREKEREEIDYLNPQVGYHARFLSEVLPDLVDLCSETLSSLVILNQVRKNIGSYTGGDSPFGGRALEHYDTVRIRLRGKVQQSTARILDPSTNEPIGQHVTCLCDKNKYDMPLKEVIIPLILGIGVNPYMELAYLATQKTDIIKNAAGRYKWAETDESIAHGLESFIQKICDDVTLYEEIEQQVLNKLGVVYHKDKLRINPYRRKDGK